MSSFTVTGNLIDILNRRIYPAEVSVQGGTVKSITEMPDEKFDVFILPGFIDAHVHVESSMLIPSEFARLSAVHGTIATVSDPHEIANVLGIDGIRYMIANGNKVPFKFYFGASSCVPATSFETAGAEINSGGIRELFEKDGLHYLSEMMNYPGVLHKDPIVMDKIAIAKELNRPIDGHAPGLMGEEAKEYIDAGISTDHECYMLEEAKEKLEYGMKIIIRDGSAAKNFETLCPLIPDHYENIMFCSDDKHPNDLVISEIDGIVRKAIAKGFDLFHVLQCACINPIAHYKLDVGQLRQGDRADFIVVNNTTEFKVIETYIDGIKVAENGKTLIERVSSEIVNNFDTDKKTTDDFKLKSNCRQIRVIEAVNGELITNVLIENPKAENGYFVSDTVTDVLKLAVVCRYNNEKPAIGFIRNFGLKKGAIASCVAHDSHNIICVGVTDEDMTEAVNAIIENKGGISLSSDGLTEVLPLPVAGIMTNADGYETANKYSGMDAKAKELGTKLDAPFMTLSFMALLVIPSLKLSDKGLFDGNNFKFVDICND